MDWKNSIVILSASFLGFLSISMGVAFADNSGVVILPRTEGFSLSVKQHILKAAPTLPEYVATLALNASSCSGRQGGIGQPRMLAIIDYALPSTEKRFWLFNLLSGRLLLEDLVAHGKNTGEDKAQNFSNFPGSLQSSLGLFQVGEPYIGKHGQSLRLIGLEPEINDRAVDRSIVIHGAEYVSRDFIQRHGRLGRSFGCPALPPTSAAKVIDYFSREPGVLFSYYPDKSWLKKSTLLNGCTNI